MSLLQEGEQLYHIYLQVTADLLVFVYQRFSTGNFTQELVERR
ncbi:hypothetical protein [Ensifer sp. 1H6]|nr:hypothetical protein [Ensifer sp. 1H6]